MQTDYEKFQANSILGYPKSFKNFKLFWDQLSLQIHQLPQLQQIKQLPIGQQPTDVIWPLKSIDNIINATKSGYLPKGRIKQFWKSNPFKSNIMGLPYTSEAYPWPESEGLLDTPRVQIDLDWLSSKVGVALGSGMVQVFDDWGLAGGEYYFRHIPRSAISRELYRPVNKKHQLSLADEYKAKQINEHSMNFSSIFGEDADCLEISSLGKRIYPFHEYYFHDGALEENLERLVESVPQLEGIDASRAEQLNVELNQALKLFKKVKMPEQDYRFKATLLGMHNPIQTFPGELGDFTLFNFGHVEGLDTPKKPKDPKPGEILFDGTGAILMNWNPDQEKPYFRFECDR